MSSVIRPEWLGVGKDPDEAYKEANQLAVTLDDFAEMACLDERAFGMRSFRGRVADEDTADLNLCMRKHIWRLLYAIQQEVEITLRWNLGPRYHCEDHVYVPGNRLVLKYGGIEAADVKELIEDEPLLAPVPIQPFIAQHIDLRAEGNVTEALLPRSLVPNPRMIQFHDADTLSVIKQQERNGYPRLVTIGTEQMWAFAMFNGVMPDRDVHALHAELTYIDVDMSGVSNPDEIYPVYPGTLQKVPVVRRELLGTGETRLWLRLRNLLDPAFDDDIMDMRGNNFYMLLQTLEFKRFTQTVQYAQITSPDTDYPGDVAVTEAVVRVIDARTGVVAIEEAVITRDETGAVTEITYPAVSSLDPATACKVRVWYKTNPHACGSAHAAAVENIRRAIILRTAAELPSNQCGPEANPVFISEQQSELNNVSYNSFTAETVVKYRYGNKRGQMAFSDILTTVPRANKSVLI